METRAGLGPVLLIALCLVGFIGSASPAALTRSGISDWEPILPEDFSSEYPSMVSVHGGATGGSGYVVELLWNQTAGPIPSNISLDGMDLNFTPSQPGKYTFQMRVLDSMGNISVPAIVNITVTPNNPPVVLPYNGTLKVNEDNDLLIDMSGWVEDPDEELDIRVQHAGEGITVNPLGYGSFQIVPEENLVGEVGLSFNVTDPFNNSVYLDTVVVIDAVPDTPVFTKLNNVILQVGTQTFTGYEDTLYWFNFTIDDPDINREGDTLTLTSNDPNVLINGTSGWILPHQNDVGSRVIKFTVTDAYGLNDTISIIFDILDVNDDPIINVMGMMDSVTVLTDLRVNFTGSWDIDGDTLSYFVKEDDGAWISTGIFHVLNFETIGVHRVWFKVEDGKGGMDFLSYNITVVDNTIIDDDDNDDELPVDDDDDTSEKDQLLSPFQIVLLLIMVVLAAIFIILLVMVIKGRRKGEEEDIGDWEE